MLYNVNKCNIFLDLVEERLKIAQKLGADKTILISRNSNENETIKIIHQTFDGEPDKSIDASGAQSSIRTAILATKSGGIAVLVGMGAPEIKIPLINALVREVDIRGVFRYANE